MWVLLQAIGLNKWIVYGLVAASILASIGLVVVKIRAGGAQSERIKQATESLSRLRQEAKERAAIEAITSAAARKQLRDKWSAR